MVVNLINELKAPYENYPVELLIYLGLVPLLLVPLLALGIDKFLVLKNNK